MFLDKMDLNFSQLTTIHLLPSSSSVRAGFFGAFVDADNAPGFALTAGGGFLSDAPSVCLRAGFLCVICDASTFFKPEVTAPPLLRAVKRAD